MKRPLTLPFLLLAVSAIGCVPEAIGYRDVKSLTAARLDAGARWRTHESGDTREVTALLSQPMTAESAGKIAVLNSPRLQAEFERLGVARAAWVSALRVPNPAVGAALVYGIHDSPELDLDASMNITGLLMLPAQSGVAGAHVEAAVREVASAAVGIAFDARRAFVEYQIAVAELSLRETVTQSWFASAEMAKRLFELGNVPELRTVNERAFYEEMRVQQARADAKVKAARERLNAALGLWGLAGAQWTAVPPEPPAPESLAEVSRLTSDLEVRAVDASLGLGAARLRYQAFAKQANLTRFAGWFPQVHAGVRVAREKDDGEPARWGVGPAVELGVPLFYQGQGETAGAIAEMRRMEATLDDVAIRTRSASRETLARLETTVKMATHYRDVILPLRGRVVEQTQLQYNAMSVGVFELLQAKNMEIQAHLTYLDVLRDYWTLRLDVEQLLAGGLPAAGAISVAPATSMQPAAAAHD